MALQDSGSNIIELDQVVKIYPQAGGKVRALGGVSLQMNAGEFLVITGRSGSGKTTLLNMVTALDRLTSGQVYVAGVDVSKLSPDRAAQWRGRTLGMVFQGFELMPTLSVLQNVMLPMDFARRGRLAEQRQRAMELLDLVGIAEHALKLPSDLSGGQQQRAAIARALANDPQIVVADEPTGSLDSNTAAAVIDIFAALASAGCTILLVTHDKDISRRGTRIITLLDGRIVDERTHANV